jgi:hypothetical protein
MSTQAQPVATTDSPNIGQLYQSFSETVPAKALDPSIPWEELTELWIDSLKLLEGKLFFDCHGNRHSLA